MKSLVFLCLLFVTLYAAQRFPNNVLDQALKAINNAKNSINTVMSDLRYSRTNINSKTQSEIFNYYMTATSRINEVLNTRLNYIKALSIEAFYYRKEKSQEAKESGKDAENCLNIVTKDMKAAAQTGYSEVESCEQAAKKELGTILQIFDNEQANGQNIKNQLDQIALGCSSSNSQQMANCIILKVAIINQGIRQYQQRASQLKNQANSQKNAIFSEQFSCNARANDKVQSASSKAIYAAVDCLKN
ncbi:hypothetical protein WN51_02354 [Melipona quadrifasciata]|uniref:Protein TsetseEP domain-containing protein n=1 Tax=Melipona quadrifasciata TaxID=166423 RepID=A0A0N0BEE8_9HYME|nr:hypothetical protein WN51_02354 [Melipona quadrifasciata]